MSIEDWKNFDWCDDYISAATFAMAEPESVISNNEMMDPTSRV